MGLAASQARFLGITARKSNIEYEGQQVNQQRTALAQEVNAIYSKLLSLKVPIAPSATDFYETNYSFSLSNTQGADGKNYDGTYTIKNYFKNDDGTYHLNTERSYDKTVALGSTLSNATIKKSEEAESGIILTLPEGTFALTKALNSKSMIDLINETYPDEKIEDDTLYMYTDSNNETHYIDKKIVDAYIDPKKDEEGKEVTPPSITSYVTTKKQVKESMVFESAEITLDSNNRFKSAKVKVPGTDKSVNTDVNTQKIYDSDGYDEALRDYTMSKDEYDKAVADLNAQTESLQEEDKVLELRLNQIDTEQEELQTELEAVKEVLNKNIENTFKTFA